MPLKLFHNTNKLYELLVFVHFRGSGNKPARVALETHRSRSFAIRRGKLLLKYYLSVGAKKRFPTRRPKKVRYTVKVSSIKNPKMRPHDVLLSALEDGEIPLSKTVKFKGLKVHAEPWGLQCFSAKELKDADDSDDSFLTDLAWEKSKIVETTEGWDGFEYFYPDETGEEYGVTVFWKKSARKNPLMVGDVPRTSVDLNRAESYKSPSTKQRLTRLYNRLQKSKEKLEKEIDELQKQYPRHQADIVKIWKKIKKLERCYEEQLVAIQGRGKTGRVSKEVMRIIRKYGKKGVAAYTFVPYKDLLKIFKQKGLEKKFLEAVRTDTDHEMLQKTPFDFPVVGTIIYNLTYAGDPYGGPENLFDYQDTNTYNYGTEETAVWSPKHKLIFFPLKGIYKVGKGFIHRQKRGEVFGEVTPHSPRSYWGIYTPNQSERKLREKYLKDAYSLLVRMKKEKRVLRKIFISDEKNEKVIYQSIHTGKLFSFLFTVPYNSSYGFRAVQNDRWTDSMIKNIYDIDTDGKTRVRFRARAFSSMKLPVWNVEFSIVVPGKQDIWDNWKKIKIITVKRNPLIIGDIPRTHTDLNRPESQKTPFHRRFLQTVSADSIVLDIHSYPPWSSTSDWHKYDVVILNTPGSTDMNLAQKIRTSLEASGFRVKLDQSAKTNFIQIQASRKGACPVLIEVNEKLQGTTQMKKIADIIAEVTKTYRPSATKQRMARIYETFHDLPVDKTFDVKIEDAAGPIRYVGTLRYVVYHCSKWSRAKGVHTDLKTNSDIVPQNIGINYIHHWKKNPLYVLRQGDQFFLYGNCMVVDNVTNPDEIYGKLPPGIRMSDLPTIISTGIDDWNKPNFLGDRVTINIPHNLAMIGRLIRIGVTTVDGCKLCKKFDRHFLLTDGRHLFIGNRK